MNFPSPVIIFQYFELSISLHPVIIFAAGKYCKKYAINRKLHKKCKTIKIAQKMKM